MESLTALCVSLAMGRPWTGDDHMISIYKINSSTLVRQSTKWPRNNYSLRIPIHDSAYRIFFDEKVEFISTTEVRAWRV